MTCPIGHILRVSQAYCNGNKQQIMLAVTEETGELATEVAIDAGLKDRVPGPDGVVGEAVDLIITAVDMINAHQPGITVEEIFAIVTRKCNKWVDKVDKVEKAKPDYARPKGCCCPPPGYSVFWGAAMCPVHHGFRSRQLGGIQQCS